MFLFVSVLFEFPYSLVYIHLLAVFERYDERSGEAVEYFLAEAVYLVVVVGCSVCVFHHSVLLVRLASLKALEVVVAFLEALS